MHITHYEEKNEPIEVKRKSSGLGDLVEKLAKPVARLIDLTTGTKLAGCQSCQQRREKLNQLVPFGRQR